MISIGQVVVGRDAISIGRIFRTACQRLLEFVLEADECQSTAIQSNVVEVRIPNYYIQEIREPDPKHMIYGKKLGLGFCIQCEIRFWIVLPVSRPLVPSEL